MTLTLAALAAAAATLLLTGVSLLIAGDGGARPESINWPNIPEDRAPEPEPTSDKPMPITDAMVPLDEEEAAVTDPLDPRMPLADVEELAARLEAARTSSDYQGMWSWSGTRELVDA